MAAMQDQGIVTQRTLRTGVIVAAILLAAIQCGVFTRPLLGSLGGIRDLLKLPDRGEFTFQSVKLPAR